ncbi:putative lipid II flippase FtsW [Candidatus Accumulibacter vicinus]|uniref:Probable peptidoglycan glycosyltransferase FtsW n=1 Tax=Candidatus Accumulibacter vicinus TaxID=2954382 RepID=A0A084XYW5_9PROT|nr:putative lipid II flippase FtsW [Candidatus Accumulibacter vicinus]KFB67659.1 MAG: Cell division protein FtsW [Candidatus Accumulibacter vicinus]
MLGTLGSPRRLPSEIDLALLWSTLMLLVIGMVMVYSASMATAEAGRQTGNQPAYFLVRHAAFLIIALVAAAVTFQIRLSTWQRWSPWLFVAGFALLALVLIPGIGREVNGARRWLPLGIVNLQPSELMKLFAVLYAADYTARKMPHMHDLKRAFLPLASAMVAVGILLLKEPDFGAFVVVISIAMGILFLGGMRARLFVVLILVLAAAFAALIVFSPYRRDRIFGFMDPWADAFGRGYQLSHALIAFGRGELFGVGLGASVEKLFYLPEAHTDFLLAVIAEELGFVGVLVVIVLFGLLIQRAFVIGRQAVALERLYSALVAQGIGVWLGVQSFINMGVNMGLLPTKGLTLPLMSFGGSGILANCVALAVLLRIDWENRQLMRGAKV